jgi:hypothetical protein
VHDLYLFGRRTDRVLFLLEVGYILLNAGASSKRNDRNYQKDEPHTNRLPPICVFHAERAAVLSARDSISRYELFFLRSAHRFFIAIDRRLLPSGVRPPRLRFFIVVPLGLPTRFFFPPPDKAAPADPSSALMARPSRSLSFAKSATNLSRSKVHSFGVLRSTEPAPFLNVSL